MSVKATSHKLTVSTTAVSALCTVNRARVAVYIQPPDGNIFIGGAELSPSDGTTGFRVVSERLKIEGAAAEAGIFAYSISSGSVEVEVIEFEIDA